jgi:O-antigen/teichoic acid export membrane protein
LLTFGARVLGANLSSWGISNLDNTFVGRVDGPGALGLYSRAFLLAQLPQDTLISTLQQVLLPALSRVQSDRAKLARVYQGAVGAVALVLMPPFAAMAIVPSAVIVGLYGNKWLGAVAVFSPLALSMPVHAMMALTGPALAAMGKTQVELRVQMYGLVFAAWAFWSAVHYSLPLLGWTVFAVYILRFYLLTRAICKELELPWRSLLEVVQPAFVLGLLTALTALLTKIATSGYPPVYQLAFVTLADSLVLSLAMYVASRFFLRPIFSYLPELHDMVPATFQRFLPLRITLSFSPPLDQRISPVLARDCFRRSNTDLL